MTEQKKPSVRRLTGGGTLADVSDGWTGFLSRLGTDPQEQGALVARNFVLDEGVVAERRRSYEAAGGARDHGRYGEWAKRHERYLGRQVFLPSDDDGPPAMLDPSVPEELPETFRRIDSGSPFLGTDPNRFLVRVEELRSIADRIGIDRADLEPLLEANLPWSKKTPENVARIKGTGGRRRRPLVTPTVLDGTFSEAFCPSPHGSATGHVVNLDPHAGLLRREVLHPRPCFRARHLWRLGTLTRPVDRATLPESRAVHLLMVRDETDRQDYAAGTDKDLLS